jgi:hypothetical protein
VTLSIERLIVLLPELLAPSYVEMLKALAAWLGKAQAQLPQSEAEALLSARLSPDMFPLSTQVRFACVQAQEGICRLQGRDFPSSVQDLLDEGRNAAERPGSIADACARIDETVALVEALCSEGHFLDASAPIAHELPMGMIFDLTVEQYARDWALPEFYFHLMIAYAILRANRINLGKADYVAHMFAYLRPGTQPTS